MGNFLKFCENISTSEKIIVEHSDDMDFPEKYQTIVSATIEIMKPKMDILDRVSIPFVEAVFNDMQDVDAKLADLDIPEGIINTLASKLYQKNVQNCNDREQAILKVLTVYIMLQIQKSGGI